MRLLATLVGCAVCLSAAAARAQGKEIERVQVASGTVLSFHLQTRMIPEVGDSLQAFPKGTVLQVKMLDSIDSTVNRDGSPFRGSMVSSLISGDNQVVVHSGAEVHGLLALLRSRSHPEGFRYELLITGLVDHGRSYTLTATLDSSFFDPSPKLGSHQRTQTKKGSIEDGLPLDNSREVTPGNSNEGQRLWRQRTHDSFAAAYAPLQPIRPC
jgi:hypothetical protein